MRTALRSAASDDIKSYDIAWLAHLVGDIHQPLHAIARFTSQHPKGDAGGNLVRFCDAPCDAPDNLHAYWDNLMGDQTDLASIRVLAAGLLAQHDPVGATNTDVSSWSKLSAELAKHFVYTSPISSGNDPQGRLSPRPDAAYEVEAHKIARQQVLLAGYRLAYLLNQNLK
jgi:S1/P1 Nuclease